MATPAALRRARERGELEVGREHGDDNRPKIRSVVLIGADDQDWQGISRATR
jgi:hypothetical protein